MKQKIEKLESENQTTREKLIHIAGEFFARKGFDGTSVRDISSAAGVNVAAISYHFGSKESLYVEAVKYVINKVKLIKVEHFTEFIDNVPSLQDFSNRLAVVIFNDVQSCMSNKYPCWFYKLAHQCIMSKGPWLKNVFSDVIEPEYDAFAKIFSKVIPSLSQTQIDLWVHSIIAQITFYVNCREAIFLKLNADSYPEKYIEEVAEHIIHIVITGLNLPKPDKTYLKKRI